MPRVCQEQRTVSTAQIPPAAQVSGRCEKQKVSIILDRNAFAHYDPDKKGWMADPGAYKILVGSSSRDIRLGGTFKLAESAMVLDGPAQSAQSSFAVLK